ncbi:MAG: hypothetical protein OXK73_07990 [Rhodospirillaceae bacterium]|nr:hypothetical protein [Rhodospirillaceae bacterium]
MTTSLRLTDAGRAAILDATNSGTRAVRLTKLALGAGSGMGGEDDDALTALRDQRDIESVEGSAEVSGQLALRATFETPTAYAVTEMGLVAQIDADPEFLLAYWTDDGTVFINKPADLRTIVAATVAIVRSEAEVTVTVAPDVTVGAVATLLDLTDGPNSYVNAALFKLAVTAAGNGFQFVSGLLPHEVTAVNALIAAAVDDVLDSAPGALDTLNELAAALGDDPDFSATVMGLIAARPTQADADARYLNKAGDTATGALRGPHPADDDESDQFATTRWVRENAGGVGNLAFFSLASDIDPGSSFTDVIPGNYDPEAATDLVGILLSIGQSVSPLDIKLTRGGADLTNSIPLFNQTGGLSHWGQRLFVDRPGTAATQTYALQAAAPGGAQVLAGSSMALFKLPDGAVADIITADEQVAQNADFLSVTIVPPSATSLIKLTTLLLKNSGLTIAVRRGNVHLVAIDDRPAMTSFPLGFEHWINQPGTTNPVTYRIRNTSTARTVETGSFLMAQAIS